MLLVASSWLGLAGALPAQARPVSGDSPLRRWIDGVLVPARSSVVQVTAYRPSGPVSHGMDAPGSSFQISPARSTLWATGIVVGGGGLVLTCADAAQPGDSIEITLPSGVQTGARFLAQDIDLGLTLLRAEDATGLLPVSPRHDETMPAGAVVMMVGHRAGKTDADFHFGRVIGTWSRPEEPRFYRIDLADCQGACGDAVLDEDGALRGIIVGVRAQREDDLGPVPGASTANPLECEWVRALSATGIGEEITRLDLSSRTPVGYLGVSAGEAEPPRGGRDTGSSRLPLLVTQVLPGSPADAAGIRPKDQIVSIDGHPITSMEQVAGAIAATPPGQRVVVRLLRDGLPLELSAKLADRSALDWLDRQSRRDAGRRKMLEAGIDRLQRQVREMDMEARRAP